MADTRFKHPCAEQMMSAGDFQELLAENADLEATPDPLEWILGGALESAYFL